MRAYIFDIDHNISRVDKLVFMEKDGIPYDIPSKVAAYKMLHEGYQWRNNNGIIANANFRDDGPLGDDTFPAYIQETIATGLFGPSIDKTKEAILTGSPICVNTARGHASHNIMRGMKDLIMGILHTDEQKIFADAVKGRWSQKDTFSALLDDYISHQYFIGVGSDAFFERYPDTRQDPGYKRKILAMEECLCHILMLRDTFYPGESISIGFSDDERHNIDAVKARGEQHIEHFTEYDVHFVCYDTSDTPQKHRITKKPHHT